MDRVLVLRPPGQKVPLSELLPETPEQVRAREKGEATRKFKAGPEFPCDRCDAGITLNKAKLDYALDGAVLRLCVPCWNKRDASSRFARNAKRRRYDLRDKRKAERDMLERMA